MPAKKPERKKFFVDARVQGALALRVTLYWCTCLVTLTLMLVCWRILTGPARLFYLHFGEMWFLYAPAVVGSFLLLPLAILDVIRVSNRFAGPLVRLRRAMRALAQGETVAPIHFREGDFWQEFADEFNAIAARMSRPQAPAAHDSDLTALADQVAELSRGAEQAAAAPAPTQPAAPCAHA